METPIHQVLNMERPKEFIAAVTDKKDLWKLSVRVKDKWTIVKDGKEHLELLIVDAKVWEITFEHNTLLLFFGHSLVLLLFMKTNLFCYLFTLSLFYHIRAMIFKYSFQLHTNLFMTKHLKLILHIP